MLGKKNNWRSQFEVERIEASTKKTHQNPLPDYASDFVGDLFLPVAWPGKTSSMR